jgi:hypothetical protein
MSMTLGSKYISEESDISTKEGDESSEESDFFNENLDSPILTSVNSLNESNEAWFFFCGSGGLEDEKRNGHYCAMEGYCMENNIKLFQVVWGDDFLKWGDYKKTEETTWEDYVPISNKKLMTEIYELMKKENFEKKSILSNSLGGIVADYMIKYHESEFDKFLLMSTCSVSALEMKEKKKVAILFGDRDSCFSFWTKVSKMTKEAGVRIDWYKGKHSAPSILQAYRFLNSTMGEFKRKDKQVLETTIRSKSFSTVCIEKLISKFFMVSKKDVMYFICIAMALLVRRKSTRRL